MCSLLLLQKWLCSYVTGFYLLRCTVARSLCYSLPFASATFYTLTRHPHGWPGLPMMKLQHDLLGHHRNPSRGLGHHRNSSHSRLHQNIFHDYFSKSLKLIWKPWNSSYYLLWTWNVEKDLNCINFGPAPATFSTFYSKTALLYQMWCNKPATVQSDDHRRILYFYVKH